MYINQCICTNDAMSRSQEIILISLKRFQIDIIRISLFTNDILNQYSTEHIQPRNLAITIITFIIDKFN